MEHIGYSLVDDGGAEIQVFGDTVGQVRAVPNVIRLPDGKDVHCPLVGTEYDGFKLVERWLQDGEEASVLFDGDRVIVTRKLPQPEQRLVRKSVIIDRLHDAGKLDAAYAVLQAAPLYDRQRWESRDAIYYNDPTILAVLNAVGADPADILAPE